MKTQRETYETILAAGTAKEAMRHTPVKMALRAMMAGAFIALGGALSVIAGAAGVNPAMGKLLSGLAFPVGLFLVVMFGAELFTGNNAVLIPAWHQGRITWKEVVGNWIAVWLGNFAGAMLLVTLLMWLSETAAQEPFHSSIVKIAETKANLTAGVIFLRGIGANWCVCLAVWTASMATTLRGKALACWIPVAAFVILGFEHCIANMFFIPCGWLEGAAIGWGKLYHNLLWATLGNITGGALFVGALQTYLLAPQRDKK